MIDNNSFDESEYFDAECRPLLEALTKKLSERKIPYFFSALKSFDGETAGYEKACRTPASFSISMSDDRLSRCIGYMNGLNLEGESLEAADSDPVFTSAPAPLDLNDLDGWEDETV